MINDRGTFLTYKVLSANSPDQLTEKMVSETLSGWIANGAPFVFQNWGICQSLVREPMDSQYYSLSNESISELTLEVTNNIVEGDVVHGEIFYANGFYHQAMKVRNYSA